MTKIQDQSRAQIAAFLPGAIMRALTSYFEFSKASPDEQQCKDFASRHTAAKAAISHIELLVKLAKWADLPDEKDGSPDLALMIANAQQELDKSGGGADG